MSGHRRTAVVLHGLQAQDRAWMLAELAEPDQAIVRAHLDELDALGFSLGSEMIAELNPMALNQAGGNPTTLNPATLNPSALNPSVPDVALPLQRLQQASAQQIVALLEDEPLALSARFFSLQSWPWQEAVWAQLSAPRRLRIRSSMPVNSAPGLDQFLIDTLAQRLQRLQLLPSVEPKSAAQPTNVWWKKVWRGKWSR